MVVVSDTSPISNLFVIGRLDLLRQLFSTIVMPTSVAEELYKLEAFGYNLNTIRDAAWIVVKSATDKSVVQILSRQLDPGESEAIALAQELNADYLLIDERRGWRIANERGLRTVGLVGLLLNAKTTGLLDAVLPVLEELHSKAGFWISERLKKEVLEKAGESTR